MIGGTSAMSGGMLWIPLNDQQAERGVEDSFDEVVAYVDGLADDGHLDPEVFGAFLEEGPEMLRWFEEQTPVRLRLFEGFPDYQSWADGAKENGSRSLDNDVFPFAELGSWAKWVNPPKTGWPRRTSMIEDYYTPDLSEAELADREARDCRGQGQALIGSLLKGVLDRGHPAASRVPRPAPDHRGASRRGRRDRGGRYDAAHQGAQGRDHRDRRLRVEREARRTPSSAGR